MISYKTIFFIDTTQRRIRMDFRKSAFWRSDFKDSLRFLFHWVTSTVSLRATPEIELTICNDTSWNIVPTIFPDYHLPHAARMTKHETTKKALRPKNHPVSTLARRGRPTAADYRRLANPVSMSTVSHWIFCAGGVDKASRPSPEIAEWRKLQEILVFKITTKVVERRGHPD